MQLLARNRALGSYYYVTYEGEVFGELNHCSFIYKMPKITKLGEVMEKFTVCGIIFLSFPFRPSDCVHQTLSHLESFIPAPV